MKLLKVFSIFILLHLSAWIAAHIYFNKNPETVLLVVDTSYSMKPHFPDMRDWIENYQGQSRYRTILVGSDKAMLGELSSIKSTTSIFRTAFGRISAESLKRYESTTATKRILLSDGSVEPDGWKVVTF